MGLFDGPWPSKEEHERSVHLNLIGQVNMLNLHNYELQAKLQVAQGRIEELEAALKDIIADMNGIQNPLINVRAISVGALNAASKVLEDK